MAFGFNFNVENRLRKVFIDAVKSLDSAVTESGCRYDKIFTKQCAEMLDKAGIPYNICQGRKLFRSNYYWIVALAKIRGRNVIPALLDCGHEDRRGRKDAYYGKIRMIYRAQRIYDSLEDSPLKNVKPPSPQT